MDKKCISPFLSLYLCIQSKLCQNVFSSFKLSINFIYHFFLSFEANMLKYTLASCLQIICTLPVVLGLEEAKLFLYPINAFCNSQFKGRTLRCLKLKI